MAAIEGKPPDVETLREQGAKIARLAVAILQYIGKLSEEGHTAEDSREMVRLIEAVNDLESVNDVISMNLIATGQQRLAERVDLASPREEGTSKLAAFIFETLERTVALFGDAKPLESVPVAETKAEMDRLAIAARKSVLERAKLAEVNDVLRFRLANDLIEQLKQIGRLSLRIAESAQQTRGHAIP